RRGGELPLGEAVHAVVLDDIEHVEISADRVAELAEADREGVAVARDPDVGELPVGGIGPGRDRRHAAVHGVESVTAADEVGRGLGGAADAGELHDVLRLERLAPAGLDDGGGDRVVPAAGTQGGEGSLVIAADEAELVARQGWMDDLGLRNECHGCRPGQAAPLTVCCGTGFGSTSASTPSTMKLDESGSPL